MSKVEIKPFVPSPTMVDAMMKRGAEKRARAQVREWDLVWFKDSLSHIAQMREDGIVSKAQAKVLKSEITARYLEKGYKVVVVGGAITFA